MPIKSSLLVILLVPGMLAAQDKSDLQQILDRLTRLEQENHALTEEVHQLRQELDSRSAPPGEPAPASASTPPPAPTTTPPQAPVPEQVQVNQQRIEEQSQTKVESSQKFPITISGMALFNAYLNGSANGGMPEPLVASPTNSPSTAGGASLAQSILGLQYRGPTVLGGGQVSGSLYMDFFGGTSSSLDHLIRLRTGAIRIDWKNTSIMVGQDKPIIAPRDPDSLAQVAYSPLTYSGNLWLWQPQARIEQRLSLGDQSGILAQLGVYETSEPSIASRGYGTNYSLTSSPRPALEGRFELWHKFNDAARVEIAPGFHISTTHVGGFSVPSQLFSLDWLIQPFSKIRLTGAFFDGQNDAGLGGLRQGFTFLTPENVVAVHAVGGWGQFSYLATRRLTFNIYGGEEDDRAADLLSGDIHRNFVYAANAIYKLGPNVLLGLEASQARTFYILQPNRLTNHYDVAVAYLF
jgi:hypothetical protein